MPTTHQDLSPADLIGVEAVANDGEPLGRVANVYADAEGHPKLVTLESGWHGREHQIVPYEGLTLDDGRQKLHVPHPRKAVADAPRSESGADALDVRTESAAMHHYGFAGPEDAMRARQTEPAPTPEIARAEAASSALHGEDPEGPSLRRWGA